MDTRPVAMFDSGVGGLSVLREFQRLAPNEDVIYFADTAWFPYGPRPAPEVRKRSFAIVRKLLDLDAKLIVVACNTASAAAINELREAFSSVPYVGMVPGLKPAANGSKSGRVAILATPGTFDGDLYARVEQEFGGRTKIATIPGDDLAAIVERGQANTETARTAVREALAPEVTAGADTVVLGCTHYSFLEDAIHAEFPGLTIIDTSEPVARRALDVLQSENLAAPPDRQGSLQLIVSQDREGFEKVMEGLGFAHTGAPS